VIRIVPSLLCLALLAACTAPSADTQEAAPGAAQAAAAEPLALNPVAGENWAVDYGASSIGFSGEHAGKAFEGRFERFAASIHFEPTDPGGARVVVLVDAGSAKTGDKFQESSLREGEWFDVANHPTARFESRSVREVGPGLYEMLGELTIKGQTTPVTLPFRLDAAQETATVEGSASLDRLALNLGRVSDPKAEWVSAKIPLSITLKAARKSPG